MANENQLIIDVSADIEKFKAAFSTAEAILGTFGKETNTGLLSISSSFDEIQRKANDAFDKTVVDSYKKSTDRAAKSTKDVGDELDKVTKRSRYALIGLNQVVRDLPFGFIAISNNIPVLTDQLQELYRVNNNKILPTLKSLKDSFLGAAGIGLAISSVTTIITFAVQKYGSLSNAILALTSDLGGLIKKLDESKKQFEKFNEAANSVSDLRIKANIGAEEEINDIELLIKALQSENTTRGEKETIISRIQSANQGFFKDYQIEKENVDKLSEALIIYNGLLIAQEETKVFREQIGANNKIVFDQTKLLKELGQRLGAAQKRYKNAENAVKNFNGEVGAGGVSGAVQELKSAESAVNKLKTEYQNLVNNIDAVIKKSDELRKAINEGTITEIQAQTQLTEFVKANFKSKKDLTKEEKNAAKVIKDAAKEREEILKLDIQGYKDRIKNLDLFATDAIKIFQELEKAEIELAVLDAKKIFAGPELAEAIAKISKNVREKIASEYQKFIEQREKFYEKQGEQNAKELDQVDDYINSTTEAYNKIDFGGIFRNISEGFKELNVDNKEFELQIKKIEEISRNISDTIGNIFGNLFDDITSGKGAIKSLTDSFKELAKQLAIAAIKYAIFNAVKNSLTTAAGVPGGGSTGAGLARFLSFAFGGTPQSTQNAGLSVGQGGLALAGQVTFVQRGPDLVGVLQKANNRINRVG